MCTFVHTHICLFQCLLYIHLNKLSKEKRVAFYCIKFLNSIMILAGRCWCCDTGVYFCVFGGESRSYVDPPNPTTTYATKCRGSERERECARVFEGAGVRSVYS